MEELFLSKFFFAAIIGLQFFFWHVPCNFFLEGEGGGVKTGSICVSP